jgi:cyclopropane-fatty-acyl-phospholipid synthase
MTATTAPTNAPDRTSSTSASTVADDIQPLLDAVLGGEPPLRFEFWDGSGLGPTGGPGTVHVRSVDALRRIVWAPGELGLGRAYVVGDIQVDGDLYEVIETLRDRVPDLRRLRPNVIRAALVSARKLGALTKPLDAPPEEVRPRGLRHSKGRDAQSVGHHYDVGNDFYELVLGPSMTYSCARFERADSTLEQAQASKHELISRKLGLHARTGMRLLDVGCGWGSMAMHAAREHGADVVGITISREQASLARKRVADAGLSDRVEIRLQDYRDLEGESFDAISSVGMFEHVGKSRTAEYFSTLRGLLGPRGRLLNHAISSVSGSKLGNRSFIGRYVFPDGELLDVGDTVLAMEEAGFEVRDVESLREHYARTLRCWVANLESHWDEACALVGERRARVWRLYMAGSANGFAAGRINVHQVLGVIDSDDGTSGMPATRAEQLASSAAT